MENDYLNKLLSDTIVEKQLDGIKEGDFDIIPCNVGVIVRPYDENPYRQITRTEGGLIIGINSSQKVKSTDSGEIEENDEYIACAKVIAVGPFCKNVKAGEDVFLVKHILKPVPFRKQNLWEVDEQNILCRIVPKGTQN